MSVVDLDLDEVKRGLEEGAITIVDVREPHEFAAGHIPGSVSHPLSTFDSEVLHELPGRVVFSCASGVRSVRAIEWGRRRGSICPSTIAAASRNGPRPASRSFSLRRGGVIDGGAENAL